MRTAAFVAMAAFTCAASGCVRQMMIDGQIEGTRQAAVAFDRADDWELAYGAAASAIIQFEGMHELAPDNEDALFLLSKAYTGYAFGFVEDDLERAEDEGDRELADYQRRRATRAYDKAIRYGLDLLARRASGFEEARKGEETLAAWLAENIRDPADAGLLFWLGYAWVARTNLAKDDAVLVSELYVGVGLVARAVALDRAFYNYAGLLVLGGYHARTANAELDEARALFEEALEKTERKSAIVHVFYATTYACVRADAALYAKLLADALAVEDSVPEYRLTNAVARRRAKRWLMEKRTFDACSMDPLAQAPGDAG